MMPQGFRYALARNSQATIAAMQGSDKAGELFDYLMPPLPEEVKGEMKINRFAQKLEQELGL